MDQLGRELDPDLSAHLSGCESCRAVVSTYEAMSRLPRGVLMERGAARAAVLAQTANLAPARTWWWTAGLAARLNLIVAIIATIALSQSGMVRNRAPLPILLAVGLLLLSLAVAGPTISLAPRWRRLRSAALLSVPLIALAVVFGGSGFDPTLGLLRPSIPCAVTEIVLSLAPAAIALWALTTAAFQVRRAIIAGASAGVVGILVLHLHCSIGSASHLLFFHVFPWIAVAAAVVAIRSKLPSKSFAP
jgi:hypothetical protein